MTFAFDVDFLVIGGGSGGVRAARMAATRGLRVMLVEGKGIAGLGGTCVNIGCIPKKLYAYAAHYHHAFTEAAGYGWRLDTPPRFDWSILQQAKTQEITRLNQIYAQLLTQSSVMCCWGWAQLDSTDPTAHTWLITDETGQQRRIRAAHSLIATGSEPIQLTCDGHHHALVSDDLFDTPPPAHLIVIGSGYIACEMASIYRGLGCEVTLLVRGSRLLRDFDADAATFLADQMTQQGIHLHFEQHITRLEAHAVHTQNAVWSADQILCAVGRRPRITSWLHDASLATWGLAQTASGGLQVNEHYQTSIPHLYAVGDVVDHMQLTPVALAQAMRVVDHLTQTPTTLLNLNQVPTAIFTHPSLAHVGLTESQALQEGKILDIYQSSFKPLKHTLSQSNLRYWMKCVVCQASQRVLGFTVVGEEAAEIIQGFAVALQLGVTKSQLDATLGIHPSAAEELVTLRTKTRTSQPN